MKGPYSVDDSRDRKKTDDRIVVLAGITLKQSNRREAEIELSAKGKMTNCFGHSRDGSIERARGRLSYKWQINQVFAC
jgi:hypothetical protein